MKRSMCPMSHFLASGFPRFSNPPLSPPRIHCGWFFASQVSRVTRSGSNQRTNFMPFEWAWSETCLMPFGKRFGSGSQVPTFGQSPVAGIPTGIDPPVIVLETGLLIGVDGCDLVSRDRLQGLAGRTHAGSKHRRQFAVGARDVMGDHPPPPEVLRADRVAFPEHQHRKRRADLLAGKQFQLCQFLSASNRQPEDLSQSNWAAHCPGQPSTAITPWPDHSTLKYG